MPWLRPTARGPGDGGTIFLSYGRGDDEAFVRALHRKLERRGYDVWFDRERMPSRALSFLQEIPDAIKTADRLLVVLGPYACHSART